MLIFCFIFCSLDRCTQGSVILTIDVLVKTTCNYKHLTSKRSLFANTITALINPWPESALLFEIHYLVWETVPCKMDLNWLLSFAHVIVAYPSLKFPDCIIVLRFILHELLLHCFTVVKMLLLPEIKIAHNEKFSRKVDKKRINIWLKNIASIHDSRYFPKYMLRNTSVLRPVWLAYRRTKCYNNFFF